METNDNVLEQLRSDYKTMKETLAKQEIVNDRLFREVMKDKVRSMRAAPIIETACGLFVIIGAPVIFHFIPLIGASWWFIAFTEVLMSFCVIYTWVINWKVQGADLSNCDLLTFAKNASKLKHQYKSWIKYGILLGVVWISWLSIEVWNHSTDAKFAIGMIAGMLVGGCIGGFLGYRIDRKVVKTLDEIIRQIEED